MLIPELMRRLRFARSGRRPLIGTWLRVTGGPGVLPPGRVLDAGCGTRRDACYLVRRAGPTSAGQGGHS